MMNIKNLHKELQNRGVLRGNVLYANLFLSKEIISSLKGIVTGKGILYTFRLTGEVDFYKFATVLVEKASKS